MRCTVANPMPVPSKSSGRCNLWKQFIDIFHVEADAIVADHEHRLPIPFVFHATDFNDGAGAGAGELERVSQQVLKDLPDQNGITLHGGQVGD